MFLTPVTLTVDTQLDFPYCIFPLSATRFLVGDNGALRVVNSDGTSVVIAGSTTAGYGVGVGRAARFEHIRGIAPHPGGGWVVSDWGNHLLRHVRPTGEVTDVAGAPNRCGDFADGSAAVARFDRPGSIAVHPAGGWVVCDWGNHAIRRVDITGAVVTIAGDGTPGYADGVGRTAKFDRPSGIAPHPRGGWAVCDWGNNVIRHVSVSGVVTTIVGNASATGRPADGRGLEAVLDSPHGISATGGGQVIITETNDVNRVRILDLETGDVVTIVARGSVVGQRCAARRGRLVCPWSAAVTRKDTIVICDTFANRLMAYTTEAGLDAFNRVPISSPAPEVLRRMFTAMMRPDVVIVTPEGVELARAHSPVVAAQSEYFATMFGSDMFDEAVGTIQWTDADTAAGVGPAVQWMYTGNAFLPSVEVAIATLRVGHLMMIDTLVGMVAAVLPQMVTPANSGALIQFARDMSMDALGGCIQAAADSLEGSL